MVKFKVFLLDGFVVKIEKHHAGQKVDQCGVDRDVFRSMFGPEEPLRSEYEEEIAKGAVIEHVAISGVQELGI